jgi:hypothetical protein
MRLAAYLLITASMIAGTFAAIPAYAPRLGQVAASPDPLTLAAPAGRDPSQPEQPLVSPGPIDQPVLITRDLIERLAAQGVERVRVKEFALGRWDLRWVFVAAMVGMLAGAFLLRRVDRREVAGLLGAGCAGGAAPSALLTGARQDVEDLLRAVPLLPEPDRLAEVMRRLEAIQQDRLAAFVEARRELVGRHGIAGFARLMDAFAGAERQVNRAWTAAADGAAVEAIRSLEAARDRLEIACDRLAVLEQPGIAGAERG